MARTRGLAPSLILRLRGVPTHLRRMIASDKLATNDRRGLYYHQLLERHGDHSRQKRKDWVHRCEHDLRVIIRTGDVPDWYDSEGYCHRHPLDE